MHPTKLHIESAKHIGYKSRALAVVSSGARHVSIAKAVDNFATLSILLREFNHDLVRVLAHANIPFEKMEKMRMMLTL